MAVSITLMMGRIGAVIGNLLFPILFDLSCFGPFIMIGSASLGKIVQYILSISFIKLYKNCVCKIIAFNDICLFIL